MLTEMTVKQAKARDKIFRLSDQRGLYLEVTTKGNKYWRYKYRISDGLIRKEEWFFESIAFRKLGYIRPLTVSLL